MDKEIINTAGNSGFCNIGAEAINISIGSLLASVRAEVFQCNFLFLCSSSVFQLGIGSGRKNFKSPNIAKPYRCLQ
jgi:hypothetical protein